MEQPGPLAYEKVPNNSILDDLSRVRWHPSGDFALILGTAGKLVRYEASTGTVALVQTVGKAISGIDVSADGAYFLAVGTGSDNVGRLWRIAVDPATALTVTDEATLSLGQPKAIERGASGDWAIGAYGTDSISYLYLWHEGLGITKTKGFNAGAGLTDLMWASPSIYASEAVITSHGVNGADSRSYVVSSDLVVANNWSPGFGNGGGAGFRPGGAFGMITGWSSNVVYVFDGAWSSHYLPGVNNGASPQAVAWNAAGTRALIVGRATGNPLAATVFELRPSGSAFSAADLVNQSILGFGQAPWSGSFSVFLLGADWRPGSACTEGLIVGSDNGTAQNPTFGLVVRFWDAGDPDCL